MRRPKRTARRVPKLEIDVGFDYWLAAVAEDGFDLVVRNAPLANWPGLAGRRVARQPMRVCRWAGYFAAARVPRTLADLMHHRAVLYGRPARVRSRLFRRRGGSPEEIIPPNRTRFDDLGTIGDAAVGSDRLAWLPCWLPCWLIRDDVAAARLATMSDHSPSHVFGAHALWPQTSHVALRLAIDALAAALPEPTSMSSPHPSETSASTLT